jgi:hypothetical protein
MVGYPQLTANKFCVFCLLLEGQFTDYRRVTALCFKHTDRSNEVVTPTIRRRLVC